MKNLIIAFSCLTSVILMSSCTADPVENSNTETLKNRDKISPSASTGTPGVNTTTNVAGVDDKDKSQG
jgi:hypothetical protein